MKATINNICRGNGKLFFTIDVQEATGKPLIDASFTTNTGTTVPSMVFLTSSARLQTFPLAGTSCIVALPFTTLPIEVTARITCAGADAGEPEAPCEECTLKQRIDPAQAKWVGRLNSIMHRSDVRAVRNCDEHKALDRCVFRFNDYLLPLENDPGLLQGTAFVPTSLSGAEMPQLKCLDESLSELPDAAICSPARLRETSDWASAPLWEIPFSIPLRTEPRNLTVLACNAHGEALGGFNALEHAALKPLAERIAYMHQSADWDGGYHEWFMAQCPDESQLELQRCHQFASTPTFSIVVPLFRTPLPLFEEMRASVQAQTYPHWELILVNASPEMPELAQAVSQAAAEDARIKVVTLEGNEGITLNTNAGAAAATGDYISFLDHDDIIAPDLLFEYAKAVNEDLAIDVLYCDEDKLNEQGRHIFPLLKPDFSIDLLRSHNYIMHMLTLRTSLYRNIPSQGADVDGAQDFNLTLLAVERTRNIHHVPKVLYHWRICESSTAGNSDNKRYAEDVAKRVIANHLERCGLEGTVSKAKLDFRFRVDYAVQGKPLVSIVIPSKDHVELLSKCIDSIFEKSTYPNFEVVVVENNSTEPETFAYYERIQREHNNVHVVVWEGTGFNISKLNNFGVSHAQGEYILLLNNDVEVITPNWIELMLGMAQREDVGLVGARLYFDDGTIQHAGVGLTGGTAQHMGQGLQHCDQGYMGFLGLIRNWISVSTACAMTRKSLYEDLGGFEEALAVEFNDVDFGCKVHAAGLEVVYNPYVELYHHESVSRGGPGENYSAEVRTRRESQYMIGKWTDYYVKGDPYLNPNFARDWPRAAYFNLK